MEWTNDHKTKQNKIKKSSFVESIVLYSQDDCFFFVLFLVSTCNPIWKTKNESVVFWSVPGEAHKNPKNFKTLLYFCKKWAFSCTKLSKMNTNSKDTVKQYFLPHSQKIWSKIFWVFYTKIFTKNFPKFLH